MLMTDDYSRHGAWGISYQRIIFCKYKTIRACNYSTYLRFRIIMHPYNTNIMNPGFLHGLPGSIFRKSRLYGDKMDLSSTVTRPEMAYGSFEVLQIMQQSLRRQDLRPWKPLQLLR
jgi:hypothetical protein